MSEWEDITEHVVEPVGKVEFRPTHITVCRRRPIAGEALSGLCPDCGHPTLAHVGTKECPVCRLVELATPGGRAREARIRGVTWP